MRLNFSHRNGTLETDVTSGRTKGRSVSSAVARKYLLFGAWRHAFFICNYIAVKGLNVIIIRVSGFVSIIISCPNNNKRPRAAIYANALKIKRVCTKDNFYYNTSFRPCFYGN